MSSTSSSDCESVDYCQCGYSLYDNYYGRPIGTSRHFPFFRTMGHPLIYYAEIQQPPSKRQKYHQPRKEHQNYFVKAFKWYTQERCHAQKNYIAPESSGFANWLDIKYIEYLRDSQQNQDYQLTDKDTATFDLCTSPPEPCTTKKYTRPKCPWRKRRRPCKDSGDVPEKRPNQSCEFILQPKDLTRAASEYCYPTPPCDCINISNVTVGSSNAPGTRRSVKSHSLSSVGRNRSVLKQIDTIPGTVQKGSKIASCCCEGSQKVPSKSRKVDVSCQCPEEKVIPVNTETQYEPQCVTISTPCVCIINEGCTPMSVCKPCQDITAVTQVSEPKPTQRQSMTTIAINSTQTCEYLVKEVATVTKFTCLTCVATDGMQTSDHSICLPSTEDDAFPHFMRIVCAQRLNKKCF